MRIRSENVFIWEEENKIRKIIFVREVENKIRTLGAAEYVRGTEEPQENRQLGKSTKICEGASDSK